MLVPPEPEVPEPELEDDPGDVVDPTVLLFPDGPVALVPLLSRTTLLLRSQHWLVEVPLELEPVPVPSAFAKLATASSAAPEAAAKITFFMDVPSSFDRHECQRMSMLSPDARSSRPASLLLRASKGSVPESAGSMP